MTTWDVNVVESASLPDFAKIAGCDIWTLELGPSPPPGPTLAKAFQHPLSDLVLSFCGPSVSRALGITGPSLLLLGPAGTKRLGRPAVGLALVQGARL